MIPVTTFAGRRVAAFGLARSGLASVRALLAGGAEVLAWDDGETSRARATGEGFALTDLKATDWSGLAALVLAPGVPLTHPNPHWTVERAQSFGIPIVGDTELFYLEHRHRQAKAKIVAITGTNGKSTTTALTAHVLGQAGLRVALGGNIGEAVLGLADFDAVDAYVLEMSSYQIDLSPTFTADAAALLNVTPDHLDRHGTIEHYADVKERLVANAGTAVIGIDDDYCRAIAARRASVGRALVSITIDPASKSDGVTLVADGMTAFRRRDGRSETLGSLDGIAALRGLHNMQNALTAVALASAVTPDRPIADHIAACHSFPGLAHRLQPVGRIGDVLFVNDSKATNADSTEKALASFPGGIYWILGGRPKAGGIIPLEAYFPRIARAFLIGEASDEFAATLEGKVAYERSGRLDVAVARAFEVAAAARVRPGQEKVVLLSPACASFDQFPDFEKRGEAFVDIVRRLQRAKGGG